MKITEKPLSRHGLNAPPSRAGPAGSERQIQDRKYFLVLLKNKNNELSAEIEKFKKQIEQINQDNQTFVALEKK